MNRNLKKAVSLSIVAVIGASSLTAFAGCKGKKDAVTIMTEQLNGLFNPFYSTSGTDIDVVGMTQIGMLSTNEDGQPAYGEKEATVVLDYDITKDDDNNSVYRFVLKNDLVFSDGYALTMNDVLFNMYEYLDPVYTGSSTMYSTKIKGLQTYRRQTNVSGGNEEDDISKNARSLANGRRDEIQNAYTEANDHYNPNHGATSYNVSEAQMKEFLSTYVPSPTYTAAVSDNDNGENTDAYYTSRILADYDRICKLFKEELTRDFEAAQDAYDVTQVPYEKWNDKDHFGNAIFKFFYFEGIITPTYARPDGREDKTVIESFSDKDSPLINRYTTKQAAIDYLYNFYIQQNFSVVLGGFATADTIMTEYAAEARSVLLHQSASGDEGLEYPNISGIVSLGHTGGVSTVKVNGTQYSVAQQHDEDWNNGENKNYGAVKDKNTYDVLQITVEGTDPKAIFNFGFSVAPVHYYTADSAHPHGRKVDIKNNEFGVPWASFDFQSHTIQSDLHVSIPVGAGPFVATDEKNGNNPTGATFMSNNIVYFKKNEHFSCLGDQFEVKAEKLRFQILSSNNAIDNLKRGSVDYITPQLTLKNSEELKALEKKGYISLSGWQLGYGYIGINAGKVPNIYVRRAIMAAMQTELACEFYETGKCVPIKWPMSKVSWAYPDEDPKDKNYLEWEDSKVNIENKTYPNTIAKIQELMAQAQSEPEGVGNLNIKFTIAGASITDHPTYNVFKQAADILNMSGTGFNVEVVADSQALTKLATASLAVWAAAWGSTIDPDMYQVYSPYSTASSPKTWGYEQILSGSSTYTYERKILTGEGSLPGESNLADLIDEGRTIDDSTKEGKLRRTNIYQKAMGLVLDLAVEMPVYQRQQVYVYNSNTVTGFADCLIPDGKPDAGKVNPYSSPLGKIWQIALK